MSSKVSHVDDKELSKMEEGSIQSCGSQIAKGTGPSVITGKPVLGSPATQVAVTLQKLLTEVIGTYMIVFIGCGAIVVNKMTGGSITHAGICVTWGLIIMIVVYTLDHISCHFNPAVTITYALLRGFPWKLVPLYIIAQLVGSILASGTLTLLLDVTPEAYFGTLPSGSNAQSLAMEFIISFVLMFVIFGSAFDERAHNQFAGIAIGMTILMNALVAGPISGASMNPARSIGPAIVRQVYKGLWIYVVGPILGCIAGGIAYNSIKYLDQLPSKIPNCLSFPNISLRDWTCSLKGIFFDALHKIH